MSKLNPSHSNVSFLDECQINNTSHSRSVEYLGEPIVQGGIYGTVGVASVQEGVLKGRNVVSFGSSASGFVRQ